MYTSIYSKKAGETSSQRGGGRAKSKTSQSDQISINGLEVNVRPVLEYNAKLLNGKLTVNYLITNIKKLICQFLQVKKIISEKSFIAFHEDYKDDFILKCLPQDENIKRWIDLPPHTNIVTAFDQILHEGKQFSLHESTNAGNMYQYIESLNVNLAINVPVTYIELIYDCIIQLAMGMEFAHNNGLIHGQFDLSNVMITKDTDNLIFKISDFRPVSSMNMPLTSEGSLWPFAKNKKKINDAEKMELLMLKDIYALGICILELMIGRISSSKFSISLDSLPLTWAEFPESTPLIQVLVECINIDSITQRKGKLSNIKKLLIKEYLKFFQRPFYKMELPVVGNKADVCNKKAIMALSRGEEDLALQFWEEAWKMKDEHFDTQLNYLFYKWRIGQLSDSELYEEMERQSIFELKDIGQGLRGIILIAFGGLKDGCEILKQLTTQEEVKEGENLKSLKTQRFNQQLKEILKSTNLEKEKYYQNQRVKSEHKEKIESININVNSKYFCTTSKDTVNVWTLDSQVKKIISIPFEQDPGQAKVATRILATVDSDCKLCAIYKGSNFTFQTYNIDQQKQTFSLKDTIDLVKELQRAHLLESKFDEFDVISEIKLINDGKVLRVTLLKKKQPYLIDINLFDCTPEMKKIDKFEDKSIFKYGLTYVQHHDSLNKFLNYQLSRGSLIAFPEKEFQMLVVLNREDKTKKHFYVYEIFTEKITRKIFKLERPFKAGQEDSDAFDVDIDGKTLVYVIGDDLIFQSLKTPEPIQKYIRPRFNLALHKENPAKIAAQRQIYKQKIIKNLKHFSQQLPSENTNKTLSLLLMLKKLGQGFKNKRLIQYNEEFLELHKMLIKHELPNCPLVNIESLKKIAIFDEIKFNNDLHRIRFISISSEIENNYMMLAVDGTVYKYDLSTKEMLFSFKTQAFKGMRLYDEDSYLLAADTSQLKLWEFIHHKDDAPEMVSVLDVPIKIEQVFVNYEGDEFYHIITCKDLFEVYHCKLDRLFTGAIPNQEQIKTIEFDRTGTHFYIASNKGKLYKYQIQSQNQVGAPYNVEKDISIDLLYCMTGVKGFDCMIAYVNGKGLRVINYDKQQQEQFGFPEDINGEVSQIRGSPNTKFVFAGIPSTSNFCLLKFDSSTLKLEFLKNITIDFRNFEMDDYCTQVVFMNQKCRVLEFYAIKWEFDMSKMDINEYELLDDKIIEEDEERYNQQLKTNNKGNTTNGANQSSPEGKKGRKNKESSIIADSNNPEGRPKTACCLIF